MLPSVRLAVMLLPVISPVIVALAALNAPTVIKLPPVTLPVALIVVPRLRALAVMLPVPPSALLTAKFPRVPTLCNTLLVTLELKVL